jgi:hypothetical protein
MPARFLRLAYVAEFLLALLTVLTFWSEIGGQDHLDLMPWYDKFVLSFGLALAVVMATVAAVSHENAWNKGTILYLIAALMLLAGMAGVTYYYHLHENDDEQDQGDRPNPVALAKTIAPRLCGFSARPPASAIAQVVVRAG